MFQKKAAKSRATLPIMSVYGIIMCLLFGVIQKGLWFQSGSLVLSTYLIMLLNNKYSLIKVYSRLMSCIFMALSLMITFNMHSNAGDIAQVLFILHLLVLFGTYQNLQGMRFVFIAFALIGCISTIFVQILYFVPLIWIMLARRIQVPSLKNYAASLLGIATPYWFWSVYALWNNDISIIAEHLSGLATFHTPFEGIFEPHLLISTIFITVLAVLSIIHFISYSYNENIKNRMFYYAIMQFFMLSFIFVVLQPQHADFLLRMMIICASPFMAHYFTFTKTWLTNYLFIFTIIITLLLTIYNTWML